MIIRFIMLKPSSRKGMPMRPMIWGAAVCIRPFMSVAADPSGSMTDSVATTGVFVVSVDRAAVLRSIDMATTSR